MRSATAIVLAAGLSTRMGGLAPPTENGGRTLFTPAATGEVQKLLLPVDGRPMVQHCLDLIARMPFARCVLVTTPAVAEAVETRAQIIFNPAPEAGQSGSVRLGVSAAPPGDSLLFLTGDQPFLDEATLRTILAADDGASILYPTGPDGVPKSPVLFPPSFREALLALKGDEGGRQLRRQYPDACRPVEITNEWALLDVDTPEDYERITQDRPTMEAEGS